MKLLPLISLLAVAYAAPEESAVQDVQDVQDVSAEKPTANLDMSANGVRILPRFETTQPQTPAKRTVVPYGTFSVSSTKMLSTTKIAKGPCPAGGCYVTAMQATIRYPNKKEANIDTNAWLHHIALFGSGTGQGSIWACGNERPTLRLNNDGKKYGIDFPSTFMMLIDLMTEEVASKSLTLEIEYEWVPRSTPGYKGATMNWLTVGEPAAKSGIYKFTSMSQSATSTGTLLYAIGHMHDGGSDMRLFVGGKQTCKSIMHYNLRPAYNSPAAGGMAGMSHGHSNVVNTSAGQSHGGGVDHISDPGACTNFGSVTKGQLMYAEAWYDAVAHPLMEHNGKKENLMGNMRVYIGPS